ncbi:hypothetical protein HAX54_040963, partial [Datura stramonium]|nr:hypothetical protein [Datura stramonium]
HGRSNLTVKPSFVVRLTEEQRSEVLLRAERAQQNRQAKRDDIYGEHIDLDEIVFTREIVPLPPPANAKFDII